MIYSNAGPVKVSVVDFEWPSGSPEKSRGTLYSGIKQHWEITACGPALRHSLTLCQYKAIYWQHSQQSGQLIQLRGVGLHITVSTDWMTKFYPFSNLLLPLKWMLIMSRIQKKPPKWKISLPLSVLFFKFHVGNLFSFVPAQQSI